MLIDTHAHLTWDVFQPDLPQVIQRALYNNVKTVINIGADLESSRKAADLNCGTLKCFSTLGLHPHEAEKYFSSVSIHQSIIGELEQIYQTHTEKIVAVGECGLDYHFEGNSNFSPSPAFKEELIAAQKKLFQAQILLAKKLNLPLIIHCRDSWQDIFVPILQGTAGVFHSFTGNADQAKKILDLGLYLGFTCIVTYPKNEHLREIIKSTPLDKILTETDCPFLPPQEMRGKRNEPANVVEVVKVIAQMKNLPFEEVAEATFNNALKLFCLS